MPTSLRVLIAVLTLWLMPAAAEAQELTPEQVASVFRGAGFDVEAPTHWTWLEPRVTTLRVRDRGTDRVLMVLVYPQSATPPAGALLVPGYGPSTSVDNIALVQASQRELDRWYVLESLRSVGMVPTGDHVPAPTSRVEPDIVNALYAAGRGSDSGRDQHGATTNAGAGHRRT